ncbi:2-succinyl-6-hydroxy-2,4-cyclohexadiene-1-carboxylate synthase [Vibrio sp.]|uniref:2-succinyl-6-hydroxy-2, 4-cyclohexadiene-1-carboxylate synthase n=1 Tax=Vibrio sp. TaxID=678 RepID=UPI003D105FE5
MLYSQASFTSLSNQRPVLVMLHGLLGSCEDWQPCLQYLTEWPVIAIDLPGHGHSGNVGCRGFQDCCQLIVQAVQRQVSADHPLVMVGYSLGARIVMSGMASGDFDSLNIRSVILEGGNFGLTDANARQQRLLSDQQWAERFRTEPIAQVLADWYRQPVFSSLNHEQRQTLILKRSANLGESIANMLLSTSLAKQAYLLDKLQQLSVPVHYICGSKDRKFGQMAELSGLSFSQVANAGHNVHQEQPQAFAQVIKQQLTELQ